jgi:hypothetical protein
VNPTIDSVAETARRLKAQTVANFGNDPNPEKADLVNLAIPVRGGEQIGGIVGNGPVGARHSVYWAASAFGADEVFLVADTYMLHVDMKGMSEEERRAVLDRERDMPPGTLAQLWAEGKRDGISEALVIHRFPLVGPASMKMFPYVRTGTSLRWTSDPDPGDPGEMEGAIPDFARDGYRAARDHSLNLRALVDEAGDSVGLPRAERTYHIDRAVARVVSSKENIGFVHLFNDDGTVFMDGEEVPADA